MFMQLYCNICLVLTRGQFEQTRILFLKGNTSAGVVASILNGGRTSTIVFFSSWAENVFIMVIVFMIRN